MRLSLTALPSITLRVRRAWLAHAVDPENGIVLTKSMVIVHPLEEPRAKLTQRWGLRKYGSRAALADVGHEHGFELPGLAFGCLFRRTAVPLALNKEVAPPYTSSSKERHGLLPPLPRFA